MNKNLNKCILFFSFLVIGNLKGFGSEPPSLDLPQALIPSKTKLIDQIRDVILEVLMYTGLTPEISDAPDGDANDSFAPLQVSIGMTDNDVAIGGNMKERLESLTRTVEANSCKLCHLISGIEFFQKETRKNMNYLMEEFETVKNEQFKLKCMLMAHEVNTQCIIDDNENNQGPSGFIDELNELSQRIEILATPLAETDFIRYDPESAIHHCSHSVHSPFFNDIEGNSECCNCGE
jgi:hypothetical protein